MPLLFYGNAGLSDDRLLYGERMRPVDSGLWDKYRINKLAPYYGKDVEPKKWIANYWWIRVGKIHSAFSWHDDRGREQTVFIPGQLHWQDALCLARDAFPHVMPSAVVFRLNNYDWVLIYD